MTDADRLLVELLAATDAVWRPLRAVDWSGRTPAVLFEHRSRFGRSGVSWRTSKPTAAGRKAHERQLDGLVAAGLVATFGRERRTQVRLTEPGDRRARALADLPNVDAGLLTVREVERLGGGRVSELLLAGLPDYSDDDRCRAELSVVELMALPALCRGWLESNSDVGGRVRFWSTKRGQAAAASEVVVCDDAPPPDDEAAAFYDDERFAFRQWLQGLTPNVGGEIGFIPLSASMPLHAGNS